VKRSFGAAALTGAALAAYSLYEPHRHKLVRRALPAVREVGRFSVLHLSDTHATRSSAETLRFLEGLPAALGEIPDLIALTGDLIEDDGGIDPIVKALTGFEARHGKFYVLGSHDYYQSERPLYLKYFNPSKRTVAAPKADTARLEEGLQLAGWEPLANSSIEVDTAEGTVFVAGVDDPYLERHETGHIERKAGTRIAIGLMHAPDVVSEWALNGFDLALAGHTHAGQVRFPGLGALVTNSSLPAALAGGAHLIGRTWLHVSPGLGTGRFAPIRFGARPEATLITLT
jgi:predicted MPP superfamily phosphohydrolase